MNESEAAAAIYGGIISDHGADFDTATLEAVMLIGTADLRLSLVKGGVTRGGVESPDIADVVLPQLRASMATSNGGAWFTARFQFAPDGSFSADFDYDSRPRWFTALDPDSERDMILEDLEVFPRSSQATPQWLQEMIETGRPV
jgi:hypothetical protein